MSRALHSEWTKQRTIAGTAWLLFGAIAATVALSAVVSLATTYGSAGGGQDLTKLTLTGVYIGQAIVAILAVQAVTSEYGTGMIHLTLTATPHRLAVLAAKAAIVTALVLAAGTVGVLGSLIAGRLILPGHGFTTDHGYQLLSLAHTSTFRAASGSVLYLALIALLSLGIGTAVRDSTVAIGAVLGLLYLFPILSALVTDPALRRHLQQIGPMSAGLAIQATTDLRHLPIAPWAGLGVLAAWAGAALLAGGLLLKVRDA